MICNKKEWEILDNVQVTLLKFAPMMTEKDKERVNALIYLCAESTKAEKQETRNRHKESKSVERKIPTTLAPKGNLEKIKQNT